MSKIILSDDSLFSQIKDGVAKHHRLIILFTFIMSMAITALNPLYAPWQEFFIASEAYKINPAGGMMPTVPEITLLSVIGGAAFLFLGAYIFAQLLICASYYQQRKTVLPMIDFHKFTFSYIKKQLLAILCMFAGIIILSIAIAIGLILMTAFSSQSLSIIMAIVVFIPLIVICIFLSFSLSLYFASVTDENHVPSFRKSFQRLKKVFWAFLGKLFLYGLGFGVINFLSQLLIMGLLTMTQTNPVLNSVSWIVTFFTTYLGLYMSNIWGFSINTISSYYYVKSEYQS